MRTILLMRTSESFVKFEWVNGLLLHFYFEFLVFDGR